MTTTTRNKSKNNGKLIFLCMIGLLMTTYTLCLIIFLLSSASTTTASSIVIAAGDDGESSTSSTSSSSAQSRMLEEFTLHQQQQQQQQDHHHHHHHHHRTSERRKKAMNIRSNSNSNSTTDTGHDDDTDTDDDSNSNIHKILQQMMMTKTKTKEKEKEKEEERPTRYSSSKVQKSKNNNNNNSTTQSSSSSSSTSITMDTDDNNDNENNNMNMNIYIAIPTIPRNHNVDYLLKVLQSMNDNNFPMSKINVVYNGNPNHQPRHIRWEEAKNLYSKKNTQTQTPKFLWNDKPLPEPSHPSIYNTSISIPVDEIFTTTGLLRGDHDDNKHLFYTRWLPRIVEAQTKDTIKRKNWRRKECNDFMSISQYMLSKVVVIDDDDDNDNSWIIFNQDDAVWQISYDSVSKLLHDAVIANPNITRYDFEIGLVSSAFRIDYLKEIIDISTKYNLCDYLPIDWILWMLDDIILPEHNKFISTRSHKIRKPVKHIGQISSRTTTKKGTSTVQ